VERDSVADVPDAEVRGEREIVGVALDMACLDELVHAPSVDERRAAFDPGGDDEAVRDLEGRRRKDRRRRRVRAGHGIGWGSPVGP
jgi:hypothetical protein